MAALFKDFRKGVKEVLDTGFAGSEQKAEVALKSGKASISTDVSRKSADAPLKANLKTTCEALEKYAVTAEAGVDGEGKLTGALRTSKLYPGLVIGLTGSTVLSTKGNNNVETSVEYKHALATLSTVVSCPLDKQAEDKRICKATTSASVSHKASGLSLGGEVVADLCAKKATDYSAGALYKAGKNAITATLKAGLKDASKTVTTNYRVDVNATLAVAAEFAHAFPRTVTDEKTNEPKTIPAANTFSVGALYKVAPSATVRAKINQDALISVGYSEAIRTGLTLNLSAQVDAVKMTENKVSLGLKFDA